MVERNGYYPYITTGESLTITNDSVSAFVSLEEGLGINELEKRIEKLEEGFRKIELKNRSKSGEIYDLMERVRQLNKDTIWIVVDDPTKVKYNKRQENSRKQ